MFICEQCGKGTEPHEKQYKIVVQARRVFYPDQGTSGWEIVRELKVCRRCADAVYR